MSEHEFPAQPGAGADEQSPTFTNSKLTKQGSQKKRRDADVTLKDQDAVRDYLTFKQTKGLMSESEKRLLDKIAAVCGLSIEKSEAGVTGDNQTKKV